MSYLLGITGGIGAGKTTLAAALARRGVPVHDADEIGRLVVEANAELQAALRAVFGEEAFPGGTLDRAALGRRVFADPEALDRLNRLVLPYLLDELRRRMAQAAAEPLQAVDAALLYEWGVEAEFDEIWAVLAPDGQRLARSMARLGLSESEARLRLASQLPQDLKAARADRTVVNDGDRRALDAWLDAEWTRLRREGRIPAEGKDRE